MSSDNVVKFAWEDTRSGDRGIYAQNINPDGSLGYEPLPVELTSFAGTLNGNTVTLNWQTATETNNSGFAIERSSSSPGAIWDKIGFVEGNGTSTETKNYSFADKNLLSGKYSYRLKQIDFDGSFEYSEIVNVDVSSPAKYSLNKTTQIHLTRLR